MVSKLYKKSTSRINPYIYISHSIYIVPLQFSAVIQSNIERNKFPTIKVGLTWALFQQNLEQDLYIKGIGM